MNALLSVIILNWNGRNVMEKFLPSVVANTDGEEVEVIVADNGSTDDSVEWLKAAYPSLRIIEFKENFGFAGGYDRAIRMVESPYVLLLNSDVETPPGWWQPLLEFMVSHPEAGAIQPKILSFRDKTRFEHAGAAGGLLDKLGYPYARGRVLGSVEKDCGQYDSADAVKVAWASGAAMLVSKKAYEKSGGFDTLFFAHMEEIDLCWRMMLKGYFIYALTKVCVYHYGGGALPYGNPRKTYLNFRNNLLMLYKNLPVKDGRKFLIKRRLADTIAFFFFLLKGNLNDAKAVVKAHEDYRKLKNKYTVFPENNIMKEIPGTQRSIFFMTHAKKNK